MGYLALSLLVDESHEELMLVTNTIKTYASVATRTPRRIQRNRIVVLQSLTVWLAGGENSDIASKNQFVVGLALATLGNIGSADMVLAPLLLL